MTVNPTHPPEKWSKTDLRRNALKSEKRKFNSSIAQDGNLSEIDEILFDVTQETPPPLRPSSDG